MLYRVNTEDNENKLRVVSWPDFQWVTNSQKIKQKFQTNKKMSTLVLMRLWSRLTARYIPFELG